MIDHDRETLAPDVVFEGLYQGLAVAGAAKAPVLLVKGGPMGVTLPGL